MKLEPKTEQQINEAGLLAPGVYDFECVEAEDTESKAGNDMAAIQIRIDGHPLKIADWLVATEAMAFKVRHFAETTGLLAEYEAGDLPAEMMIGKIGRVKIGIRPAEGQFRAKNNVVDYVPDGGAVATPKTPPIEDDDEIPF